MSNETINRLNVTFYLIKDMLARVDKTLADAERSENWWFEWEMPFKRYQEFEQDSLKILMKVFKCNKTKAKETFGYYYKQFGLKVKL